MTDARTLTVTAEQQVEIESRLAQRLASASSRERIELYGTIYDHVYEMHLSRDPETLDFGAGPELLGFLENLTQPDDALLEIGCGGGLLAIEMAKRGRRVLGIDVSARILEQARVRAQGVPGLSLALSRGTEIPAADGSFDLAYSVEVLEHLHAEDVSSHLKEVHRVLRPGGRYWLLTPNRFDRISSSERFGVEVGAGDDIHLKEWTYSELDEELRSAGFSRLRSPWRNTSLFSLPMLPASLFAAVERFAPSLLRHRSARALIGVVACSIVAEKPDTVAPGMRSSDASIAEFHNLEAEQSSGESISFSFGRNWQKYLRRLDGERLAQARESLHKSLKMESLDGKTFIDAGCGSAVFSLSAHQLGAAHVTSIDIDPASIDCARQLRERARAHDSWDIRRGSLLDSGFVATIAPADIVYSWGVLHHTGAMWEAIASTMQLVRPGGLLCLALYRRPGRVRAHMALKRSYNALPGAVRPAMCGLYCGMLVARQSWSGRISPWTYVRRYGRQSRGMSLWRDVEDWLGGLPCEFATPGGVQAFAAERGFELRDALIRPPGANNEYLLHRQQTD